MARHLRKPRVHLIVEGKTEDCYFKKLNNNRYFFNVTIHPSNSEGINKLMETFRIDEKVNEEVEYRYIVIDGDANSQQFNDCLIEFKTHDSTLVSMIKSFL